MRKLDPSASLEQLVEQFRLAASEVQSAYHQLEQEILAGSKPVSETVGEPEGLELPNLAPLHLMGTLVGGLSQSSLVLNQDLEVITANDEAQRAFHLDGRTALGQVLAAPVLEIFTRLISETSSQSAVDVKLQAGGSAGVYDCIYLDNPIEKGRLLLLVVQDLELDHLRDVENQILKNLTGTLVHEIRTPLTSMQGFAELLLQVQGLDPGESDKLQFIRHGIDRLNLLASALGTVFREIMEPHWIKVNLNGFLEEVVTAFSTGNDLAGEIIALTLLEKDVQLVTDPELVREAIQRSLENAIEAMDAPGPGDLAVSAALAEEVVVITIRDHGVGAGEEDTADWWVPFFTSKSGHLGLGLVQVRRIMETLGGSAELQSAADSGMAMRLSLPL